MLTDRPDVPRTPFGHLKPPNGGFGGQTQEHAYNLNEMFLGGFLVHSFIKNNIFLRLDVTFNR